MLSHEGGRWGGPVERPWDEIVVGLWQGSSMAPIPAGRFDRVLTLDGEVAVKLPPPAGTVQEVWAIDDGPMPDPDRTLGWTRHVAHLQREHHRVLVRCAAGQNRSGLIVVGALVELGWDPWTAIRHVRDRRGPFALSNPHFVDWLLQQAPRGGQAPRASGGADDLTAGE